MKGSPPQALDEIISPRGKLSDILPFFEFRPQQYALATAALKVFEGGGALLAEVGTGTGKTLGYLVPAVLAGKQTIVSTGTKNLQEQIYNKDIPLLRVIWPGLKAAYLKGRANYLCSRRLIEIMQKPFLPGSPEAEFLSRVAGWSGKTDTGDRAELEWLTDDDPMWPLVSAEHETCLSSRCEHQQECFITRARKKAAVADIVVVNHYLLLAEEVISEPGMGLLPEGGILVIDEAHLLEEVATRQLGLDVSTGYLAKLLRETSAVTARMPKKKGAKIVRRGFEMLDALILSLPKATGTFLIQPGPLSDCLGILSGMAGLLRDMSFLLEDTSENLPEMEYLYHIARRYSEAMTFICSLPDPDYIYWYERRESSATFYASPVDVSRDLPGILFDRFESTLLTSATLAVGGNFRYIRARLGLDEASEMITGSPFDYRRQAVLFIPSDMPHPNSAEFPKTVARKVIPLLKLTKGRAFVLCTSRRNLDIIQSVLKEKTSFRVIRQGDAPRSVLLEEFISSPMAVLVATTSFWQGVDVPGEALSAVIVDRLPFAPPDDPVTYGRIEHVRAQGCNPFSEYQLPAAVIMLKQGLGRLIRRKSDQGLLAIMDPRIRTSSYGRVFLSSLPDMRVVGSQRDLQKEYRALRGTKVKPA